MPDTHQGHGDKLYVFVLFFLDVGLVVRSCVWLREITPLQASRAAFCFPLACWEQVACKPEWKQRESMSLHLLPEVGVISAAWQTGAWRHSLPSSLPTSLRKINKHIPTCPPPPTKGLTWQGSKHNNSLVPISPDNPINQGNHKSHKPLYNPGAWHRGLETAHTYRHRGNLHLSFLTQHTCQALPMHSLRLIDLCLRSLGKYFFFPFGKGGYRWERGGVGREGREETSSLDFERRPPCACTVFISSRRQPDLLGKINKQVSSQPSPGGVGLWIAKNSSFTLQAASLGYLRLSINPSSQLFFSACQENSLLPKKKKKKAEKVAGDL